MSSGLRRVSSVRGSIFSVERILQLPDDDCNILFFDSQSLHLLNEFANNEAQWSARYADTDIVPGLFYVPVTEASANYDFVRDVGRRFAIGAMGMNCSEIVEAIKSLTSAVAAAACCGAQGEGPDTPASVEGGSVPPNVGSIGFAAPSGLTDRKCRAANWIHNNVRNLMLELQQNHVDDLSALSLTAMVSIVSSVIGLSVGGVFGALFGAVGGAVLGLSVAFLSTGVQLDEIVNSLDANEVDLICALYNAGNTTTAKSDYLAVLELDGLGSLDRSVVGLLLYNAVLNVLFFSTDNGSESELAVEPITSDCDDCGCVAVQMIAGTHLGGGDFESAFFEDSGGDVWAVAFGVNVDGAQVACGALQDLEITLITGWSDYTGGGANGQSFRFASVELADVGNGCTGWDIYCDDAEPGANLEGCRICIIRSDTEFDVSIAIT